MTTTFLMTAWIDGVRYGNTIRSRPGLEECIADVDYLLESLERLGEGQEIASVDVHIGEDKTWNCMETYDPSKRQVVKDRVKSILESNM